MTRQSPFVRTKNHAGLLHLTSAAESAIAAVAEFGPIRSEQIRQLVWPRPTQRTHAESTLRRLFEAQYLDRLPFADGLGPPRALYVLGPEGRRFEAERRKLTASTVAPRPAKQRSYKTLFLSHHLATVQVVINLKLAATRLGGTLTEYRSDRQLRRERTDAKVKLPVIPDAFVALNVTGRTQGFFIELDRATKTAGSWRRRFADYWEIQTMTVFDREYARPAILIIIDAVSRRAESRIRALKEVLESDPSGRDVTLFWFAKLEDATANAILTQPRWQLGGREDHYSLLPSSEEHRRKEPESKGATPK